MRYSPYSKYKPCEHPWIAEIPSGWELKKLKYLANCFPSNVDKKTKDGEQLTLLCNYTDVYYNEEITPSLEFMKASASDEQIKKFTLKKDDVVITKDSEDPEDIAVPSVVQSDLKGVICGYHLAMVRAYKGNNGRFLKRVFDSNYARSVFATTCNGLTRYGLGAYALDNVLFPQPPLEEQTQIAAFLDKETAKIDTLIEKQEKLIKFLQEKRQAVISHAVTKGLNPDAKMKDSGIEWLGEIPEEWDVWKLNHFSPIITCGVAATPEYVDDGIPFLSAQNIKKGKIDLTKGFKYITDEKHAELTKNRHPRNGDILLSRVGTIGEACIVDVGFSFSIFVSLTHLRLNNAICLNKFFVYLCESKYVKGLNEAVTLVGGGVGNLNVNDLREYRLPIPNTKEQQRVIDYLDSTTKMIDKLIEKSDLGINLIKERRAVLISAAVTGKIDVRQVA